MEFSRNSARSYPRRGKSYTQKENLEKVTVDGKASDASLNKGPSKKIIVRQTLTSKLRMEKANPLLTLKAPINSMQTCTSNVHITPSARRATFNPGMLCFKNKPQEQKGPMSERRQIERKPVQVKKNITSTQLFTGNRRTGLNNQVSKSSNASKLQSTLPKQPPPPLGKRSPFLLPAKQPSKLQTSSHLKKPCSVATKAFNNEKKVVQPRAVVQRTLKSPRKSHIQTGMQKPPLKSILRSRSECDITTSINTTQDICIKSKKQNDYVSTPKSSNRTNKSVAFFSPFRNAVFSASNTASTPPPSVLRERLNEWLKKRGKLSYSFNHLRCFGLHSSSPCPEGTKANSKTPVVQLDETITLDPIESTDILCDNDNIRTSTPEQKEIEDLPGTENKENVDYETLACPDALEDLKKLIFSGYPRDQCEQWVSVIYRSHPAVKDLPQYWECLAALEEARGDFSSAVDCYGRAIVKGADTEKVDESLDKLWERFSMLSTELDGSRKTPTRRSMVEPKYIFKSSIIKFALQQKAVKRFSSVTGMVIPTYVVTPVRRSTRKSISQFKVTPTLKCVDSLNELEHNVKENMEFQANAPLNPNK